MDIARYLEHNGDKEMEDASVEEERGPDAVELVGNVAQPEREEPAHVVHARHLGGDGVSIVPGQEGGGGSSELPN